MVVFQAPTPLLLLLLMGPGKIIPTRGLRQSDPPSPFIFILVVDCLTRMLNYGALRGFTKSINVDKSSFGINHSRLQILPSSSPPLNQ